MRTSAITTPVWMYGAVAVILVGGSVVLQQSVWRGSTQLHTLMELTATLVALFTGAVALVRYFSKRSNTYLFVGVGFVGTAFLDGYHAVVTSTFFGELFPSPPPSLIPWSWNASRVFLSMLMVLTWWTARREARLGGQGRISEKVIFYGVAILTLASFSFFAFVPLPPAYYPNLFFGRPEEFLAGVLFLVALVGFLLQGDWKSGSFEHWVVLSLIVGFVSQAVAMSRSFELFDAMFDLAHLMKILGYLCVLIGLTSETYQMFVRTERNGEQTRRLVETSATGMLMVRRNGLIVFVNSALANLMGYSRESLTGQPVEMLLPEPAREQHPQLRESYFQQPEVRAMGQSQDLFALHSEGRLIPVEIDLSPIEIDEELHVLASVVDIAQRKRLEEQREQLLESNRELARSNKELDGFAYVASHDLKAPLRGISHLVSFIKEDSGDVLPEKSREHLEKMQNRVDRLERLLDDLLNYSRAGRVKGDLVPTDTAELVRSAFALLAPPDGFCLDVDEGLPTLTTHRVPLEQVFRNLMQNAIKHHDQESGSITVSSRDVREFIEFTVSDDGPGIAPQFQEQVFEMFQTLKPRDQVEGSGMGLAIVRKIIEWQGGTIGIDSNNRGTAVRFTWPRGISDDARLQKSG